MSKSEKYNKAVEQVLALRARLGGRMPTVDELARDAEIDLSELAKALGVESPKMITIEVLHEIRRREGRPEETTFAIPSRSPLATPEKRYLGAAIPSREANDRLWKAMKQESRKSSRREGCV